MTRQTPKDPPAAAYPDPIDHPSLAAAVVALQGGLPRVSKGHTANIMDRAGTTVQYAYSYADLADCYDAIIPVMQRHGLSFTVVTERSPDPGRDTIMAVGLLRHGPTGETDRAYWPIRGENAQAQGSSLTYARRYLLCAMTGLVADADDDGAAEKRNPAPAESQAPPDVPQENPERFPLLATDEAEKAATDTILTDLRDIAYRQDPTRDLTWITAKWRAERGHFPVSRLHEVHPDAIEPLYQAWHARMQGTS